MDDELERAFQKLVQDFGDVAFPDTRELRPEPLEGPRMRPDGETFPWGVVEDTISMDSIAIVQYIADNSRAAPNRWHEHGERFYHAYLWDSSGILVDTETYYETLDEALIGAICHKYAPDLPQAPTLIYQMLEMDE